MATAKIVLIDANEPSRKSYLWIECKYNGGSWWQEPINGNPKMVLVASRGEWKKEEITNGKAGKWGDRIMLYHAGDRIATFLFDSIKQGNIFDGKYVSREEYPSSQGDLFWKGDFKANILSAPPAQKKFSISAAGGVGLGYGIAGKDYLRFQIKDIAEDRTAYYFYDGIGLSVGIKKLPSVPVSGSTTGPQNIFTTHGWRNIEDFEGSASSGGVSLNVGTSTGFNWFTFTDIKIAPFDGGNGWALPSVGHTEGSFKMTSQAAAGAR